MDSITLCMIAPEFFPIWGGTGSYTIELVKHLPRNVDIHVVTLKRSIPQVRENSLEDENLNVIIGRPLKIHYISTARESFYYNLAFQIACLKNIPKLHKKHEFDIMHSHLSHMPDVFLQLLSKAQVKTVTTVHSTIRMQKDATRRVNSRFRNLEWSEKQTLLFYPMINLLQQNYAKRISRFIAVSNTTKELASKHLNVETERIDVIHNGVDTQLFHPPIGNELENRYSRLTVVYSGRIMASKGLEVLIRAIPLVLQFFPETTFLFAGGGNIKLHQEMAKNSGIPEKSFSFVGHLGFLERPKLLRETTVFVNPSFFENCSISILEAMSSGVAVVASDVGGNHEIIESGKNGLLVPVADHKKLAVAIVTLLKDENLNKEVGKESRKTVEKSFSSKKCAEETYKVYKQILDNE